MPFLREETWTPASFDDVAYEWVRGEQHKLPIPRDILGRLQTRIEKLLNDPDRQDPLENARRRQLMLLLRGNLLRWLPPDTNWYRVEFLRDCHIDELLAIGRCGWDSGVDENELRMVTLRWPEDGQTDPRTWVPPILWGHTTQGPFTILEGNHRLVFHVRHHVSELQAPVLIGLSSGLCHLHKPDPPLFWE